MNAESLSHPGERDLPEGWSEMRVSEFFDSWGGMTPSTSNKSYWGGDVSWVSSRDIKQRRVSRGQESITRKALAESRLRLCPIGSVLVVVRSGILSHTLPVAIADAPLAINQDLKAFWCPTGDLNEWLALALRARASEILAEHRKDGTTVQSVRYGELCRLAVAVPPLAEQKRIVEKVELLLARINQAQDRLARVPAILRRFRQAVLSAACSGRLTADWRKQVKINHNWFEEIENRLRNRIVADGRGEWFKPDFGRRGHVHLPERWHHIALGNLGEWLTGGTPSTSNVAFWDGGDIPWLSPKDMKAERITDTQDHITKRAAEETRLRLIPKSSVVFVVRGLILARSFPVATLAQPVTINQDIRAIIPNEAALPEYVLRAMQSESLPILFAVRESTHGTRRLESATLKRWPIALPPPPEQGEIVRRVEALFKLADAIEKRVAAATAHADKLTQAILAKAFRGELVPTEAELARREGRSYEPASALLERIRASREKTIQTQARRAIRREAKTARR